MVGTCDGLSKHVLLLIVPISPLSDKSKRRTKTVKKSVEPRWNQTFMYSPVHRRDFRERMLELTVWDQARVREEESQFLGEVRTCVWHWGYRCDCPSWESSEDQVSLCVSLQVLIELESALLDDQPHWYKLQLHDVSSLPLPSASPYLQRRGLQPEHSQPSRRLQSEHTPNVFHFSVFVHHLVLFWIFLLVCWFFVLLSSHDALPDKGPYYNSGNNNCVYAFVL